MPVVLNPIKSDHPFGMVMPGRSWSAASAEGYRFGFNGMEADDEVKGQGNCYTTEFRQYDPRLGRWLSLDPKADNYPWQSPFAGMDNRPIKTIDPTGESGKVTIDEKSKTITIKSKNYYFSKGGRPNAEQNLLIKKHAQNIQNDWNAANAVKVIDGVEYKVQFEVEGKALGTVRGSISFFFKEKIFKKGENNFIKVGPTYSTNSAVGGSTQEMTLQDFYNTDQKTDSHEQGHLWGWFDKEDYDEDYPKRDAGYHDNDRKSDGSPSIMQDRNKLTPEEYSDRKVTQDDVDKILDNKKLEKKKTYKL